MFTFFDMVATFVQSIVTFFIRSLQIIYFIIESAFRSVTWLIACIGHLPFFISAFVVVPICLAVVFQVLNKGS